jgi:hypothetical protein
MSMNNLLALIAVAGVIFVAVVTIPTILHYRHERWKARWEHEREKQLRALDLGTALPAESDRESWFSPARVGLMIGAGVPIGAFFSAMVTSVSIGFHEGIWIATGIVGLGAVLSGAMTAGHAHLAPKASPGDAQEKPVVDEDAYDVVSARG